MTSPIQPVETTAAPKKVLALFEAIQATLGMVPNFYRVLAQSPATLSAYLGFSAGLAATSLSPALREKIALAIAEINDCSYCLAAHHMIGGKMLGLDDAELMRARSQKGKDAHETALLSLAAQIVEDRGRISDDALAAARRDGVTDQELVELIAVVAEQTFSNYINHIANTPLDLPEAPKREA